MTRTTVDFNRMLRNYEWECDLDEWDIVNRLGCEHIRAGCSNCDETCYIPILGNSVIINGRMHRKYHPSYSVCGCGRLLTCRRIVTPSAFRRSGTFLIGSYISDDELEHDEPDYDDMED